MSKAEDDLAFQLQAVGIPFEREYRFCPDRRWRADFYIQPMILVEIEGFVHPTQKGGHQTMGGILRDIEKYNEAQLLLYDVFRFTQKHIVSGEALRTIERAIEIKLESNN